MDIDTQAIDELLQSVRDTSADISTTITIVPSNLIPEAIKQLGALLTDAKENASVHQRAVLALREIGRSEAVPFLGQALTQDGNVVIRRLSMAALEQIDLFGGVPYFRDALNDSDEPLRESAIYALGTAVTNSIPNLDVDDAILHQQTENLLNGIGILTLSTILAQDNRPEARQAAATALGYLDNPAAIDPLCQALQRDDEVPGVLWNIISALRKIGTPAAVPCLGQALIADASPLVRQQAAGALEQIADKSAIPFLAEAIVEDPMAEVRNAAISALTKLPDWQAKTDQVVEFLQSSRQERATINNIGIVRAIKPPDSELVRDRYLLTDYLVGRAVSFSSDPRMTAIMAKLIIDSTDGILSVAGERVNAHKQKYKVTEAVLQTLRVEIGGTTALNPILGQLQEDLKTYFQEPIAVLNEETRTMWRTTIKQARVGFIMRAVMSGVVFALGAIMVSVSFWYFLAGRLALETFFGPGVAFVGGVALMLNTIYRGPLNNIRKAVNDVGVASTAFIGYIHRVQQISHTFSFLYLQQQISAEELHKLGVLIEDAMDDTIRLLGSINTAETPSQPLKPLNTAVSDLLPRDSTADNLRRPQG